jgi:hypothetical protein
VAGPGPPADVLASGRDQPRPALPRGRLVVAALCVAAVAAAVLAGLARQPPPPPEHSGAALAVVEGEGEGTLVTEDGAVVLAVALGSPATTLTVRAAQVNAAPVRATPTVVAPQRVEQGGSARLVLQLEPDCRVLGPEVGGEFVATLLVEVETGAGREESLTLAFGSSAPMQAGLAGLCGGAVAAEARAAGEAARAEEAREVGLDVRRDLRPRSAPQS